MAPDRTSTVTLTLCTQCGHEWVHGTGCRLIDGRWGHGKVEKRTYVAVDALLSDHSVGRVAATIENECGTVRGIGPAVRRALGAVASTGQENG